MRGEVIALDLRGLPPDRQAAALREQYVARQGSESTVRALVGEQPARLYIQMLEGGYRVTVEGTGAQTSLVLRPDGSRARLGRRGAHSIAAHSDGRLYVNTTGDRVAVIDASTRTVRQHIPAGQLPSHLALSDDGRTLFVANADSNDVTIIDTAGDRVRCTTPTGRRPLLPCPSPNGDVYLPSGPDRTVTAVDAEGEVLATLPVGDAPHDIGVAPDGRWAYQPNSASHTVTVIDAQARRVVGDVAVGLGPGHVAFAPDGCFAYVANTLSDEVTVLDTASHEVVARIPTGAGAHLPVLSHDGRRGYVADFAADDLTVWDVATHRVIGRIPVGVYPHFFALSPDDRWIVVSNTGEASACLIDTSRNEVVARLPVGQAPAHIGFDPEGACAFVTCEVDDHVSVIDLARQRIIDTIPAAAIGD
jgi:YVTN family beta-propeller protein